MAQTQQQNIFQNQRNIFQQQQRHRLIAPATTQSRLTTLPYSKPSNSNSVYAAGTTLASNNPAVVRRNARERNRVKQVNNGFLNLRQHIPAAIIADLSNGRRGIGPGASKKLSKVDTLRMAVEYIRRLQHVIDEVDSSDASSVSSYNSCGSSGAGSPPPSNRFYYEQRQQEAQRCYGISYAGSFTQSSAQQNTFTSPAQSNSSYNSTDSFNSFSPIGEANNNNNINNSSQQMQLKFEPAYDEYTNTSTDDEELLDYISLWQSDM